MSGGTLTYFFFFLGVVMAVVVVAKARFLELVLGIVLVLVALARTAADRVIRVIRFMAGNATSLLRKMTFYSDSRIEDTIPLTSLYK